MAAHGITDIIQPGLRVLFCGINPGKSSAHTGFHFAYPGNRFWKTIFQSGFTRTQLKPEQERPTLLASELSSGELRSGGLALIDKIERFQPAVLAVLGKQAYRQAFRSNKVEWGRQPQLIAATEIWVLPNPSGLNRASQQEMTEAYSQLHQALDEQRG